MPPKYRRNRTSLPTNSHYVHRMIRPCPRYSDGMKPTSSRSSTRPGSSSVCSWTRSSRRWLSRPALLVHRLGDAPRARHARSAVRRDGPAADDGTRLRPPARRKRRRPQDPESRRRSLVPPGPHCEGAEDRAPRLARSAGRVRARRHDISRARLPSTSRLCESSERRCDWRWRSPKRDHAVRLLRRRARPGSRPRPRAGAPARRPART